MSHAVDAAAGVGAGIACRVTERCAKVQRGGRAVMCAQFGHVHVTMSAAPMYPEVLDLAPVPLLRLLLLLLTAPMPAPGGEPSG